jgi:TRAP transporter TAXI family solute receptor
MTQKKNTRGIAAIRPMARFVGVSLRDLVVTSAPIILVTLAVIWAAYWFVRPAPPDTITITSGPPGSTYMLTAEKYQKILARDGVKLKVLPSAGSLDNLTRLNDPKFRVDVGFVQGGVAGGFNLDGLVSLGSIFHLPLLVFYRSDEPVILLSDLSGKRLAIGPQGSGTHVLSLTLLKANGIEPGGPTQLLELAGEAASQALLAGTVDAAFLMGDSATPAVMRTLIHAPGIRLLDFPQAAAYTRRNSYLEKLDLPMGAIDFGKNVPAQDVHLIGPTAELVARRDLHPALSDMLIAAAREVHGKATLMQRAREFPAPLEHEFTVSADAQRFYNSGKSFLYRTLPFRLASFADRLLVFVVPVVVLLIPGLKLVPALYSWRVRSRIYRWYGTLIALERSILANPSPQERAQLIKRLDDVESEVNKMKMPLAYAEQFYVLRDHIKFVGDKYRQGLGEGKENQAEATS